MAETEAIEKALSDWETDLGKWAEEDELASIREARIQLSDMTAKLAAAEEKLSPSPCGVEGHRAADWVPETVESVYCDTDKPEIEWNPAHCLACSRESKAAEDEAQKWLRVCDDFHPSASDTRTMIVSKLVSKAAREAAERTREHIVKAIEEQTLPPSFKSSVRDAYAEAIRALPLPEAKP